MPRNGGQAPTQHSEARVQFGRSPHKGRSPQNDQVSGIAPALKGVPEIRLVEIHGNGYSLPLHELYSEARARGNARSQRH